MEPESHWRPSVERALAAFGVTPDGVAVIHTTNNAVFRIRRRRDTDLALRLHRPGYRTEQQTEQNPQRGRTIPLQQPLEQIADRDDSDDDADANG